jgi:hypothetical protein
MTKLRYVVNPSNSNDWEKESPHGGPKLMEADVTFELSEEVFKMVFKFYQIWPSWKD